MTRLSSSRAQTHHTSKSELSGALIVDGGV
jgi:hypothetical protein